MDYSTRKKMGCIGIIVAVIAVILGYFVYKTWFDVAPTCFDGKQNQNERCIDGGGVCARVCPMDAKTIVPLWSRVFHTAGDVWSVLAYVENQNETAGVQKINYEFRVYDSENILAGEPVTGSTFIGPNERTAIFESPIKTGNRTPSTVFFKFTSAPDWMTTDKKYTIPQLGSANIVLTDVDKAPKLSADIVNNTLFDYKNIEVVAILYDEGGNAINASKTLIESLPQQTRDKVYFTWPKKFEKPVTRIEIIPRLNPFTQK
jgi:ferredoxin